MKHNTQMTWLNFAAIATLGLSAFACGTAYQTATDSAVKVTNGREIAETDYPSVVYIASQVQDGVASCTATFVNDSQVVSAAHCVEGTSASNPSLYLVKVTYVDGEAQLSAVAKAQRWVRPANYNFDDGVNKLDVSVISFPANSAPAVSALAAVPTKAGDSLTIVGYGNNRNFIDDSGQFTGSGAGKKRVGTNQVGAVVDGMIQFIGTPSAGSDFEPGSLVLSGSGDSGGPLFVNGRLAGVTSGGGVGKTSDGEEVYISQYVDLKSADSQALLKKALKPGTAF